ncbi:uncharacterized protein GGS22DRAFT_163759 [Annulohypoxylon maeteangense]|uniref:uncharacterized protein n=1 Tax=Annulohypoxylon maeteangense TaxID=1927788 RepID=UPI002008B2DD|nr:uncharacterized protein GGS22DRAFT_163759 [Annulohypoxylon maeteangense]KAI0884539.1 hypothetical protein GGS22DRAFT_163759 [Annulohypoxylon maeteangense]
MASPREFKFTSGGKEYIDKTIKILTPAFHQDPVFAWLLHKCPIPKLLSRLFRALFKQASLNKAILVEVDDFSCCGILIPPGARLDNPWTMLRAGLIPALVYLGPGPLKRAIFDYQESIQFPIEKVFTVEELKNHWYVFIMGTSVDHRRQGFASALLAHMQERAKSDGRPIWLEATTVQSRALYLKHGFEAVGEVVLGIGKVGPDGMPKKSGKGVSIWPMFWRP